MEQIFITLLCSAMVACILPAQTLNIPTANNVTFWGGAFGGPNTLNINDTTLFLSHNAPRQFMLGFQWHYTQRIAHKRFNFNTFSRGLDLYDTLVTQDDRENAWNDDVYREWLLNTARPVAVCGSKNYYS